MALNIEEAREKMSQVVERLHEELKKIRTGRASGSMLDGLEIEAYGQPMPLKHAANIVALDGQMLQVTPFDPNNLGAISTAINNSSLGLNPSDDGHVVRVAVPPLNEERRRELVKTLGDKAEEARVALRNVRHDAMKNAKSEQQEGELSEDDYHRVEKQVKELTDGFNRQIDEAFEHKQSEIITV
ncbi:MAG TPA: ribosome recycling factor [Candidatus Saccharimonadales bacterium]